VGRFKLRHSCELVIHGGKIGSRSRIIGGVRCVVVSITVVMVVVVIIRRITRINTILVTAIIGVVGRVVVVVVVVVRVVSWSIAVEEDSTSSIHERQTNSAVVTACQGMYTVNNFGGHG
jgi:ascorbate-specific PTS system EIIC-type component UlaA